MSIPFTGGGILGKADNSEKRRRTIKVDSGDQEDL
jgi:hypothetical protein